MLTFLVDLSSYDGGDLESRIRLLESYAFTVRPAYDPPHSFIVSWSEDETPVPRALNIPADLVRPLP